MFAGKHDKTRRFTSALDIWSLVVVALAFAHGLPDPPSSGYAWCRDLADLAAELRVDGEELAPFLAKHMLVMDPNGRSSAMVCVHGLLQRDGNYALQNQVRHACTI